MSRAKVNFDLPTGIENLDITVNFTSKIYPVVSIEAMTAQGMLTAARLMPLQGPEAVSASATITTLTLKQPSVSTSFDEAVGPTATITALTLNDALESTTIEDEAVGPTATITTLTLNSALITNTVEPEALGPTATITGLELS